MIIIHWHKLFQKAQDIETLTMQSTWSARVERFIVVTVEETFYNYKVLNIISHLTGNTRVP